MASYDEHNQIFRLKSVGNDKLLPALKHNKRELHRVGGAESHIDATLSSLNYALCGQDSAQAIANYARSVIALAGIEKLRKNGVMAVELVFSLPIKWHKQDTTKFFKDCFAWTLKNIEGVLLSFDIHLDESAPHAHALVLPLIDGKMQGDKLKGDKSKIKQRNKAFYDDVASHYGLIFSENKYFRQEDKDKIAREIMKQLNRDGVKQSAIFGWVRDEIFRNPLPVAKILGIDFLDMRNTKDYKADIPKTSLGHLDRVGEYRGKHFVDCKRAKGKGRFIT